MISSAQSDPSDIVDHIFSLPYGPYLSPLLEENRHLHKRYGLKGLATPLVQRRILEMRRLLAR